MTGLDCGLVYVSRSEIYSPNAKREALFLTHRFNHMVLSTLLRRLLGEYQKEGFDMPYTIEDFKREVWEEVLNEMPLDKRLEGVPLDKRLEGVPLDKRLEGLSVEELEAYLKKLKNKPPKADG